MIRAWFVLACLAALALQGCAAGQHALLVAQRAEIARAEAAGAADYAESQFYLHAARTEVREAEQLFRYGKWEDAKMRLGNAQADARLAFAVAEAEQARRKNPAAANTRSTSIPASSLFRGKSDQLLPGGQALLDHLARQLAPQQDRTVALHTYAEGDQALAEQQAARVKDYLLRRGLRDAQLRSLGASLAPHGRLDVVLHAAP